MSGPSVGVVRLPHAADLPLPQYQSAQAAGLDLIAAVAAETPLTIAPGTWAAVPTGLVLELPDGTEAQVRPRSGLAARHGVTVLNAPGIAIELPKLTEGQIRPRSGLAARHGISVLNAPGTIDADYRGELQVLLVNLGPAPFVVTRGTRIAQLVVAPTLRVALTEVRALGATARGAGGFGSTG